MISSRLFVKGLPPNITEHDFRKHFAAKNQEITDVKVIPQRRIGYVGYKSPQDASNAVKYFNKSYIRMSRLTVEIAKPISDFSLARGKAPSGVGHPKWNGRDNQEQAEAPPPAESKKRKRDVAETDDHRLQQYLHVMKSGREGVAAEDTGFATGLEAKPTDHIGGDVSEEASDDEYEKLPVHKEKQARTVSPPRTQAPPTTPSQRESAGRAEGLPTTTTTTDEETGDPKMSTQNTSAPDATDDDWLRSRTNRLLDLVDPEQMTTPPTGTPHSSTVQDTGAAEDTPSQGQDEMNLDSSQGETVRPPHGTSGDGEQGVDDSSPDSREDAEGEGSEAIIGRTSRLFVRNLPYNARQEDIRTEFEKHGELLEAHLCLDKKGVSKGFAFIHYVDPSDAVTAFHSLDKTTFQGRIIHIIPGTKKKDVGLSEFELSKLPLKQQNKIRKKAEASSKTFSWNSLYMSQDAVNASIASRLGISKSELLDPTSADAAVKQALAETTVIQETKAYFAANGVDLDAFKSEKRGDTAILVKNFPYGTTIDELRSLFEQCGPVTRVLMPPSGTIGIVQFAPGNHAKTAFRKLAYSRIKDRLLYLEKAPTNLLPPSSQSPSSSTTAGQTVTVAQGGAEQPAGHSKLSVDELLSRGDQDGEEAGTMATASLFVRNLNFVTTTSQLKATFEPLDGFVSARVKTKTDAKRPGQTLSMGFGFVEFRSKEQAQAALKVMDGYVLDDHTLAVKASHKGMDAADDGARRTRGAAAGQRTKIVIKNLPFQATKKDIRALFGAYGQLRSVRVPKKADYTARGFAFADFVTPREAEHALKSLKDTHLLGRRLVLDFAEAEAVDAEEEIEKMQRKVGGQANRVALQKLTGGGRKRINIGEDADDVEG